MNRKLGRVGKELNRVVFKKAKTTMKCKAKCEKSCAKKSGMAAGGRRKNIKMIAGNPMYINPNKAALKR